MDLKLKGKKVFVSGSSSGIGVGVAREFAAEGCDVAVHGRDKARAEQTAHEISKMGVKTVVTVGDLAKDSDAANITGTALKAFGKIDILINNCGLAMHKENPDWSTLPPKEWVASYEVNFVSGLRLAQAFVPAMKEQKWGRVVNISSTAGTHIIGQGGLADYGAPKAALNKFTADMSKTVGPFNITCNAIIPGTIMTPAIVEYMAELKKIHKWGDDPVENERLYTQLNPQSVPRLGDVRDIATACCFLSSPLAGYINGAFLRIDGGMAMFA
jgi:NAD(P)-dependent dehydrogenase (short-subunit alcohol dehydrogenase family)